MPVLKSHPIQNHKINTYIFNIPLSAGDFYEKRWTVMKKHSHLKDFQSYLLNAGCF